MLGRGRDTIDPSYTRRHNFSARDCPPANKSPEKRPRLYFILDIFLIHAFRIKHMQERQ